VSAALAGFVACRPGEVQPAPPPFRSGPIEQVPRAQVLEYARRVPFVPVSGDSQRLMIGSYPNSRYGPLAHIDPAKGSFQFDEKALSEGRILARVINVDTIDYPKLNLGPRDTIYWWVDRRGPNGGFRSVFVSSRLDAALRVTGFRRERHPELGADFRWKQAEGRFLWRDTDEQLWIACVWAECCRSDEALQ
jgi:hypothetical protein